MTIQGRMVVVHEGLVMHYKYGTYLGNLLPIWSDHSFTRSLP